MNPPDGLLGVLQFYANFLQTRYPDILDDTGRHLMISGIAVAGGALVAIPLGIYLAQSKVKWVQSFVFTCTNVLQTIPSLAMLALLIPLFGIGPKPAIFALFLYSLLPILRSTFAGLNSVDASVLESARGMGYGPMQQLFQIKLPLALPYLMSGLRMTTVYIISWTTLAALIGAGGLGDMIVSGIGVNKKELVFTGAAAAIILALLADWLLGAIERLTASKTRSGNAVG
ncbi:MAG: binding-protein-dependent transport system inner rane component [Paenibacillaceae bacterium]|jgi:osmoprotectant transport system permease protein|nr:binding-protein-dependent transport system inner rane component [Paenibacillaceae bacterium]